MHSLHKENKAKKKAVHAESVRQRHYGLDPTNPDHADLLEEREQMRDTMAATAAQRFREWMGTTVNMGKCDLNFGRDELLPHQVEFRARDKSQEGPVMRGPTCQKDLTSELRARKAQEEALSRVLPRERYRPMSKTAGLRERRLTSNPGSGRVPAPRMLFKETTDAARVREAIQNAPASDVPTPRLAASDGFRTGSRNDRRMKFHLDDNVVPENRWNQLPVAMFTTPYEEMPGPVELAKQAKPPKDRPLLNTVVARQTTETLLRQKTKHLTPRTPAEFRKTATFRPLTARTADLKDSIQEDSDIRTGRHYPISLRGVSVPLDHTSVGGAWDPESQINAKQYILQL
mmetsp:Transcript_132404/g.300983  ORF Transcript_132404/g.300983 Transcript_132404/m.300983 type:complete len:345 (+) Transcript_132404:88-1122(+)